MSDRASQIARFPAPARPETGGAGRVVIFTDVDGTLLDDNYKVGVPRPTLKRTFESCDVVLVSSRTIPELTVVRKRLGSDGAMIGENGGMVASYTPFPGAPTNAWEWETVGKELMAIHRLASPRGETMAIVRELANQLAFPITLLSDLSPQELARRSGYRLSDARRAADRSVSVLIDPGSVRGRDAMPLWDGLHAAGCTVTFGGRWISVVRGADKGTAALAYLHALAEHGERVAYSIGIGNEANDEALLRAVDRAFVIRNPTSGHAEALATIPGATLLTRIGCAGWQEMTECLT